MADRYLVVIHQFVTLNALRDTRAADAAITQAIAFLRDAVRPGSRPRSGEPEP